jgi:hypothetical protein
MGSGGGAGTETKAGAGGKGAQIFLGAEGQEGEKFTALGPGHGGAGGEGAGGGGGGGGGYYGGGGGGDGHLSAAGGGGGGSDFCATGASSCTRHAQAGTKHEAGLAAGDANVTLTYTAAVPTSIEQCKKNGWKKFDSMFKNQGQCVSFVEGDV